MKEYLNRNYGTCKLERCLCKDSHNPRFGGEWVGTACTDWLPTGASTWDELRDMMMRKHGKD